MCSVLHSPLTPHCDLENTDTEYQINVVVGEWSYLYFTMFWIPNEMFLQLGEKVVKVPKVVHVKVCLYSPHFYLKRSREI